jgi:hypothetical protein
MPISRSFTKSGPGRRHVQGRNSKPRLIHKGASSRATPGGMPASAGCVARRAARYAADLAAWRGSTH